MSDALAAAAQLALYVGILCASGGVFAATTLNVDAQASRALARLTRAGAIVTILATLGGAIILIYRLGGQFDEATISAVLMSAVGAAGGMRLSGALLLLLTSADDDTFVRGMRTSYGALLVASFVFSGHGAAAGVASGLIASVHVAIAGWWLASLLVMERSCATRDIVATASLVARFSKLAVGAIVALIVAGVVLILTLIAWPVVITAYVATLAVKLAIVVLVLALAGYNRFTLTPRLLANDAAAVRTLRSAILLEIALIAAALVATTLMTTYNAPEA